MLFSWGIQFKFKKQKKKNLIPKQNKIEKKKGKKHVSFCLIKQIKTFITNIRVNTQISLHIFSEEVIFIDLIGWIRINYNILIFNFIKIE